jgi:hypothetical protein
LPREHIALFDKYVFAESTEQQKVYSSDAHMNTKNRLRSPKTRTRFIHKIGIAVFVVLFIALVPMLVHLFVKGTETGFEKNKSLGDLHTPKTQEQKIAELSQIEDASSEINGKWRGVCKKNSIHSVEDFKKTVQSDPVLARHFAGFNWSTARIEKQDKEIYVFVTHREDDVIQQTTKPIRLPKDDGYITDGVRAARTYCCNDIDMKPTAGALTAPPSITMTPTAGDPGSDSVSQLGWGPVKPSTPGSPPQSPNVTPVPEPSTMLLLGICIAGLAGVSLRKRLRR